MLKRGPVRPQAILLCLEATGALVFASELEGLCSNIWAWSHGWAGRGFVRGAGHQAPPRTAGAGVFEGVRELKGLVDGRPRRWPQIRRYWLESRPHERTATVETVEKVRHLLEGAIRRQLQSATSPVYLPVWQADSSMITAVAARAYQEQESLETLPL